MVFCCGFIWRSNVSCISITLLCSMLFMWSGVEGWSYFYSDTTMSWEKARSWCRNTYTDMVAIQNQDEITHLNSWLPRKSGYYWIGIRKINETWTWVGTNKALTKEATNWAGGEPNNAGNNGEQEDCVEMYVKRNEEPGKWNDERCWKKKTALCYAAACKKDSCLHGECVETINSHMCQCFDGFYGEKCEKVVKCNKEDVTVPDKGSVNCVHSYGEFSYNSSCQYSCEEGYELSRPRALRCTGSATWSEQPPTCELVQCPQLSQPERGAVTCSDPLGPSSYQSTCEFSCDAGYALAGSLPNTLRCEATGSWNASEPFCVAVRCPALQDPEDGAVTCGADADNRFSYGNTCSFSCEPGYRLVGPSAVTCTSAAEWTEQTPRCEAITCQQPEEDQHLMVQCSRSFAELRPNATCSFSCGPGFSLQGADSVQCSENGQWSEAQPFCRVVQCPQLSQPERGAVTCSDPLGPSSYQSTCEFSCDAGYALAGSLPNTLRCEATGSWNASEPFCVAVRCPALQDPEDGAVTCGADADNRFSYGNTCSFSCEPGYRLVGPSAVTCTSAAEWTEQTPRCEAITCQQPEEDQHLMVQCSRSFAELRPNATCSFSCGPGFSLQGADSVQCSENGQWSEAQPSCRVVRCLALEAPENGQINCSNSEPEYGSQCSFACDRDYTLDGHELLTCDRHGNWTRERPICQASHVTAVVSAVATGGTLLSALSVAMWILKRLKQKANKFELNSNSDIEAPTEIYKTSADNLLSL